jgi:hypothetical protein
MNLKNNISGNIISTISSPYRIACEPPYQTAAKNKGKEHFFVIEYYDDYDSAIAGHKKIVDDYEKGIIHEDPIG